MWQVSCGLYLRYDVSTYFRSVCSIFILLFNSSILTLAALMNFKHCPLEALHTMVFKRRNNTTLKSARWWKMKSILVCWTFTPVSTAWWKSRNEDFVQSLLLRITRAFTYHTDYIHYHVSDNIHTTELHGPSIAWCERRAVRVAHCITCIGQLAQTWGTLNNCGFGSVA